MKVLKVVLKIVLYAFLTYMLIMGFVLGAKYESSRAVGIVLALIGFSGIVGFTIFFCVKKPAQMIKGYKKLQIGMTVAEVVALFGKPTGKKVQGNKERLIWRNSEFKGMARGGTIQRSIVVDFENGQLIGYDSDNMGMSAF